MYKKIIALLIAMSFLLIGTAALTVADDRKPPAGKPMIPTHVKGTIHVPSMLLQYINNPACIGIVVKASQPKPGGSTVSAAASGDITKGVCQYFLEVSPENLALTAKYEGPKKLGPNYQLLGSPMGWKNPINVWPGGYQTADFMLKKEPLIH